MKSRLYLGFASAIFLVILVGAISLYTFKKQTNESLRVRHSYKVINQLVELQNLLIDMETGRRGFRSTNERRFLEPYFTALARVEPQLESTRQLLEENPDQLARFKATDDDMHNLMSYWKSLGEDASQYTREIIISINLVEKGKMDTIRRRFRTMENAEMSVLAESESRNRDMVSFATYVLEVGTLLILIIVGTLIYFILKEFNSRTRAEKELLDNNEELVRVNNASNEKNWLLAGLAEVNDSLQGLNNTAELCDKILRRLVGYLKLDAAAIYLYDHQENNLSLLTSIALPGNARKFYALNEGFVGRAATQTSLLHVETIPDRYISIPGGVANVQPKEAVYLPLYQNGEVKGVIELFSFSGLQKRQIDFLELIANNIVVAVLSAQAREEVLKLLETVQSQKEELENQQEELRQTNEELSVQTEVLQASEEELRVQEEELRQINAELEEKNEAIETARHALMLKANELEANTRFKSEFLANMSHELRTPLNSVLILAKLLADNKSNNLTEKQIAHAKIIYKSGSDLLQLINDILDLSKIEAGKADLSISDVNIASLAADLEQVFLVMTDEKGISLKIKVDPSLPSLVQTDRQKLEQIIRNLLSNAIKFTPSQGSVSLTFSPASIDNKSGLAIRVQDTGIGISPNKQQLIFEAFQQADGSTSRKFGGTGLGLSITKELVRLLGGKISVESEEGKGSTFSVLLPLSVESKVAAPVVIEEKKPVVEPLDSEMAVIEEQHAVSDDRHKMYNDDRVILIIEDDETFAAIMRDMAREKGFKTLVATRGDEGLYYAKKYQPHAIILDMNLPVIDGRQLLKLLKSNKNLRHIPVHIVSAADESTIDMSSALAFLRKPVQQKDIADALTFIGEYLQSSVKKVLLVAGEHLKDQLMVQLFSQRRFDVKCELANSIPEAIEILGNKSYDCIIADIGSDTERGIAQLQQLRRQTGASKVPLIIYLDKDISATDEKELKKLSEVIVRKSLGSNNRLMDELELFLYKVHEEDEKPSATYNLREKVSGSELKDKKVLVVDDDMRNVFALTSALEYEEINVVTASDGKDALEVLRKDTNVDLVLMDVMMPEMDGFEAIKIIRNEMRLTKLPIIALTAKAMIGDREKCIQAGASDYITKPVDIQKLVSLMRVWLS